MANYTYRQVNKPNHAWIACLRIVNPVETAGTLWREIHFTEPKSALVQANLRPHVTFESTSGTTHWYLKNAGGVWTVEFGNGRPQDGEEEIALNVVADAVANNWIRTAPPAVLVDDEGFKTPESRGGKKKRMQKGWQQRTGTKK